MKPAEVWDEQELRDGARLLGQSLKGVGDRRWERMFRMCATLCLHRGLSDEEIENMPGGCSLSRVLAGGPVVVYYSRGVPEGLRSCDPCESPGKNMLTGPPNNRWPVWLPVDCGRCQPCLDRAAIEGDPMAWLNARRAQVPPTADAG